jgi:hypothetical protein
LNFVKILVIEKRSSLAETIDTHSQTGKTLIHP